MVQRALLFCGILSPILYALADTLAGLNWEAYSFRDQAISELGAVGAPSAHIFSILLIPTYLLLAAFGIGVWNSGKDKRNIRIAGGLLIGFSILALTVGQFVPMQPRGTEQGLTGLLHLVEGGIAMLILLAAMGFAAADLGRRFRLYTISTIILILTFGAWSAMDAPMIEAGLETPWVGVKERIWWYAYQLWFIVLALTLFQQQNDL